MKASFPKYDRASGSCVDQFWGNAGKPGNDGQTVDTPSLGQTKLPQWAGNLSPFCPKDMLSMFTMLTTVSSTKNLHKTMRFLLLHIFSIASDDHTGHFRAINLGLISFWSRLHKSKRKHHIGQLRAGYQNM